MAGGTLNASCTGSGSGFGRVLIGSTPVSVTSAGEFVTKEPMTSPLREFECKILDEGTIWNPTGGGAGKGTITPTTFGCDLRHGNCTAAELIPGDAPWNTLLTAGPPITDKISGIEIEVICHGALANILSGSLKPEFIHGKPSVAKFTSASGLLGGTTSSAEVIGEDAVEGPSGEVVWAE
jgi:hypothetical protein